MAGNPSTKQLMINKANSTIVAVTAIASAVVVFCLVASFMLVGQLSYQNRVIGAKKVALEQLNTNIENVDKLVTSYNAFVSGPQNILGGVPDGDGPQDGDNAKIVLDALPSKYDFPALATSLEKILTAEGVQIENITGTDDEVAQSANTGSTPQPVEMPFEVSVSGNYDSIKKVVNAFQRSIRPIKIQKIVVTGGENDMKITITATTYYQPEKVFGIRTEVVK